MSLQVWLPLNGDLHNQGLADITVTNNGATIDNNGKIGKCYSFNGSSSYLYENTYDWSNFNTSEFSLCCWYKEPSPVASGNSQIIHIGTNSGWNNIRIGLLKRFTSGYPMFSVSNGSSAVNYNFTASTFSLDTWNHIAVTYKNGELKMYLNGVLDKISTTTIIPVLNSSQHLGVGAAPNGAEKLTGFLNDVRIYDHALSAKEVEEIAKGLILHYKLELGNYEIDINSTLINDCSGYNNNGTFSGTLTTSTNTPKYNTCQYFDGASFVQTPPGSFNWFSFDQYTMAAWFYPTASTTSTSWTGSIGIMHDSTGRTKACTILNYADTFRTLICNGSYTTIASGKSMPVNEWHHCAVTVNDTTLKMYFDGILVKTSTISWGSATSNRTDMRFSVAKNWIGTDRYYTGNYSDIRLYVTALTDTQILELYSTSASIDRNNNIHTRELVEV